MELDQRQFSLGVRPNDSSRPRLVTEPTLATPFWQMTMPGQVVVTLIQNGGRQGQAIGFDDVVLRRRIGGIEQVTRDVVLVGLNPEPALNFMLAEVVGQ